MKRVGRRRTRRSKGFAMVEALVALAIAALTLTLLTSASWGLKLASERRVAFDAIAPADWLMARRILQSWAQDLSNDGPRSTGAALLGTATTMRMLVRDRVASSFYVGELRIDFRDEAGYTLHALRHDGLRDARTAADTPRVSKLLTTSEPIRFVYLFPQATGAATVWRYETGDGDVLPLAIAIEMGSQRLVTVPVLPTISQTCLSALGPGGLEGDRCAVR